MPLRDEGPVLDAVSTRYPAAARAFDLVLALAMLPLALPLGCFVALAVALDSPGPVLFRSPRVGRDGRMFPMLKFRTMRHLATGPSISSRNDERYTPVGRLLAGSRLDELPQLWHVIRGEMRLVGPRPELEEFVLGQADSYRRILSVPPGITGPTQLVFADEGRLLAVAEDPEREYVDRLLPRKVQLDLRYASERAPLSDLALLGRTWLVPTRRLSSALPDSTPEARRRAGLVLARAALFTLVAVGMVAIFAVEGAGAL